MLRHCAHGLTLTALVILTCALGCSSGSDLTTYPISGTVRFGEQPIPNGSITLIPDSQQGNSGAAVSMDIVDGKFSSASADRGHIGGPHLVRIVGLDGQGDGDLFPNGQMLFPDYETTVDLPQQETTQDFVVPGDRKMPNRRPKSSRGA